MKRYLLFSGQNYYAGGGFEDFAGDFETYQSAIDYDVANMLKDWELHESVYESKAEYIAYKKEYTWAHIYDLETKTIIWKR